MRVALLGDIHGNAPALAAVLADAERRGAERLFNVGDCVGEAPFPNETIDLLRAHRVLSIRGNFDRNLYDFDRRIQPIQSRKHPARVAAVRISHRLISAKNRRWLRGLPEQRTARLGELSFLFVHGSPRKTNERIQTNTPKKQLAQFAQMTDARVIVCGHTHRPFVRKAAGKVFINTGSAGRPANDPRACYVLADCRQGRLQAKIVRVRYPVRETIRALRRWKLPKELEAVFRRGVKLRDRGEK